MQEAIIKLLQDQLRVTKESHSLDIRVIHDELDSIKNRLEDIHVSSAINGPDAGAISSSEPGVNYQCILIQKMVTSLNDIELSKRNFAENVDVLRKGFKSMKAWNVESAKDLELMILKLEERLTNQRHKLLSG